MLGRLLTGLAHTLVMVGSLTAVLQDRQGPRASMRLNTLEFAGMLGVLGGLALVGLLPERWPWNLTLLAAAGPVVVLAGRHARADPLWSRAGSAAAPLTAPEAGASADAGAPGPRRCRRSSGSCSRSAWSWRSPGPR